jgi:SAM-dependent methyltransferase
MRAEAGDADRRGYVAARAEALPLATSSADLAWLSTVIHQFDDLDAAAAELRRVLRRPGCVLVRGLFSDMAPSGLLAALPGIERAVGTFPSTAATLERFAAAGFVHHQVIDVPERWEFAFDEWVERVRSLRHTDSILRPLTDDEIDEGIAVLTERYGNAAGPVVSTTVLRLLAVSDS